MSPSCPVPDGIDPQVLRAAGFATVEILPEAGSTMERARELAAVGECPLPAAVVADRQTAGRGRRGAHWWQPPGSLAVSIVLQADRGGPPPPSWSLACGVALAETLREIAPAVAAVVRWPNDLEVAGRKLAGILVEAVSAGRVIFGIGVNTAGTAADAPPPIRSRVATLPDLAGRTIARERVLAAFLPRFRGLLAEVAADPAALAGRYRPLCGLEGKQVTIHVGPERHRGICRGIAADGSLVLETSAGRMQFASGSLTDPADVWCGGG
jgi:BirA family biotin operon repressor/biotin-[acetyl-CoA-carboxylase] ligase